MGDASGGESEIFGDLLAFAGAVAIVGYMLAGRRLRRHVPALSYNSAVYSVTAVVLLIAAILAGDPFTGYTSQTYLWLVMVALVPQVIGHSLLNWALAHVTATAVGIAVMAEPVIAIAAAVIILGEAPPLTSVLGGVLILSGIYVCYEIRAFQALTRPTPNLPAHGPRSHFGPAQYAPPVLCRQQALLWLVVA